MGIPESLKDEKLVTRVCAGHLECFEALVDRHFDHVRLFTAYRCPFPDLVDAIACDTFVFALKNIHRLKAGTEFRSWLRAIAINFIATRSRQNPVEAADRFNQKRLAEFARIEGDPYAAPETDLLEGCVHRLPHNHQELLKYRYGEGNSAASLAARVGKSPNVLRLRLLRLRQEIIGCLKGNTKP